MRQCAIAVVGEVSIVVVAVADSTVAVGSTVLATVDLGIVGSSIEDYDAAVDTVSDVDGDIGLCFAIDLPYFLTVISVRLVGLVVCVRSGVSLKCVRSRTFAAPRWRRSCWFSRFSRWS